MALVEGMQYGLSSQGNYSSNKSLIFVKLTDSALRAIGDLTKSRNNSSFFPTVQFQGNQGVITLPRPQATNSENCQKFGFSLSNVEAEGPQGSFECIQQTSSRSLQSFGCMVHKMHIHANEESYEKTRVKMASVEKESKMNCTKEIKASGPYVGRKVKVKRPMSSLVPAPKATSPTSLTPVSRPIPKPTNYQASSQGNSLSNNSSSIGSSSLLGHHPVSFRQASTSNSSSATTVSPIGASSQAGTVTGSSSSSSNSTTTGQSAPSSAPSRPHGNPDIMRRSYRERVIHLLALRPYKKPELLARLMKDGIKEKDKKGLSAMLSKVAQAKDNTYSLARYCWNEVQEDWPFYTHEEKELLKRRKPQNATPPNETDHPSPTAIHSSHSPPFPNSQSQKRPPSKVLPDYNVQQPPKKQRISHYITNGSAPSNGPPTATVNSGGYTLSSRLADPSVLTLCTSKTDSSGGSVASRKDSPTTAPTSNPWSKSNGSFRTEGRSPAAPSPSAAFGESSARTPNSNNVQRSQTPTNLRNSELPSQNQQRSPSNTNLSQQLPSTQQKSSRVSENGFSNSSDSAMQLKSSPPRISSARESKYLSGGANSALSSSAKMGRPRINPASNVGSAGSRGSSPQSSPESQDSVEYRASSSLNSSPNSSEIPDYISKYVGITNRDQRAKYKADFNAEYNEYRKLHAAIEEVKSRFEALEVDLHRSISGSEEWHRIRSQIVQEYEENHRGHHYRDTKRRLNYLHDKLSHIKRLVVEYDQAVSMQNGPHHHHHHPRGAHPSQQRHRQQVATA